MKTELKILFVEDVEQDAELIWKELKKNKISFKKVLVNNRIDYLDCLENFDPDIIISDYSLPQFDGKKALILRNEKKPLVPFILVTGSLNEEVAVDCMKTGADDYILKDNLSRLGQAVLSVMRKKQLMKEKLEIDEALHLASERLNSIFRVAPTGIGIVRNRVFAEVNDHVCQMTGYSREELVGMNCRMLYFNDEEYNFVGTEKYRQIDLTGSGTVETRWKRKDEEVIHIILSSTWLTPDNHETGVIFTALDISDRKKAENELKKSEFRLQKAQVMAHVGNWELDLSKKIIWGSEEAMAIYGFDRDKLELPLAVVQMMPLPEYRPILEEALDRLIRYNEPYEAEYKILRANDSKIRALHTKAELVVEGTGSKVKIIGVVQDITDRKLAEENLDRAKKEFQNYFESGSVGMSVTLPDMKWIEVNHKLCQMFGFTREELIGMTWAYISHPDDIAPNLELFQKTLRGEINNFVLDKRFICKDGSIVNVTLSVVCERNPDGSVHHFLSSYNDITERIKAEERVLSERSMLRTLIDNLPDAIYVKDAKGRKIIANTADLKNIGCTAEAEVLGKTDLELFPGDVGMRGMEDDLNVLNTGLPIIDREEFFFAADGTTKWFLTTKVPLFDKNKKVRGLVGIGRDITRQKEFEEELVKAKDKAEESDRLKTAFLHNISHEIRTPMNAIIGFTSLLDDPEIDTVSRKAYIDMISQSSTHLLSIITDIVDISNIEADLVRVAKEELNVNAIMKTIYNQQIQKAKDKKIDLICESELSDAEALVISDKTKLLQILSNLVNNAIKFTSSGSVKLSCRLKVGMLEFSVADTGIGIPLDLQTKIFDRFYQVQNAASRSYEGTGLGLAISKAYIELLGGSVRVISQPDKGSAFFFNIPYDTKNKIVKTEPSAAFAEFVFPVRKKILVAEDNESNFKLIKYFLKDVNAEIIRAINGQEAVDYCLSDSKVDLILMDIKMPVMDGYTAVKILRESKCKVPVIAQTAYAIDKENAIEAGCSDFISKPFDKFGLLRKISEYI